MNSSLSESDSPAEDVRLRMYREMLRIRMVEEEIVARYSEQEMRCQPGM